MISPKLKHAKTFEIIYGNKEKGIGLLPHQRAVQQAMFNDGKRFILETGGIRSGKSYDGARKFAQKIMMLPAGSLGWIIAPTYKMTKTSQTEFDTVLSNNPTIYNYLKSEKTYNFINGVRVDVRTAEDADFLRGPAPNIIWGDEISMLPDSAWKIIRGRVSTTNGIILVTTTTRGRNWLYYDFFLKCKEKPEWYYTTKARTADNPMLSKSEMDDLYDLYKGDFALQELEGEFVNFEGQIYSSYNPNEMVVYQDVPYEETKNWENVRGVGGIDFGWNPDPQVYLCGLFYEKFGIPHLYLMDEIYQTEMPNEEFTKRVKEMEGFYTEFYKLKKWSRYSDPNSVRDRMELNRLGLDSTPAPKPYGGSINDGIRNVFTWFSNNQILIHARCTNLQKELGMYQWKIMREIATNKPQGGLDHACDSLRYMIMSLIRQEKKRSNKQDTKRIITPKHNYRYAFL